MLLSGLIGFASGLLSLVLVQAFSIIRAKPKKDPATHGCLPVLGVALLLVLFTENSIAALVGFGSTVLAFDLLFDTQRWRSLLLRKRDERLG